MAVSISTESLGAEIQKILAGYNDEVIAGVKEATRVAMKTLVSLTKKQRYKQDTARYRRAISSKKLVETPRKLTLVWYVKYPFHGLSHLLESGHEVQGGGRSIAYRFIENAVDQVQRQYVADVEKVVRG
jgi:hypothetical protein